MESTQKMSYQITLSDKRGAKHRRAAARFVGAARRRLLDALADHPEITQSDIARELGVNRAVINRQLRGTAPMSMTRCAEIASVLGCRAEVSFIEPRKMVGDNAANAHPDFLQDDPLETPNSSFRAYYTHSGNYRIKGASNEPAVAEPGHGYFKVISASLPQMEFGL